MTPETFRHDVLEFFEAMRLPGALGYGRYRYAACQDRPVLYASCYAALARHLLRDLDSVTPVQKTEWLAYIQSFQADDGFFKDPAIAHPGSWYVPPHMAWCGWWHLSCHVIMALTALGGVASRDFAMLHPFCAETHLRAWLAARDLNRIDFVGNEILNLGQLLQYARDVQHLPGADRAVAMILDWLDRHQDPGTGLWGSDFSTPQKMNAAYQGAYHFYLLYDYDQRPIRYADRIIDSMLSMQTRQGGFGLREETTGCEDIDAIDPLVRMTLRTDYRRTDVGAALRRGLDWVLANRTADGGFTFWRSQDMFYGSRLMTSARDEGSTFATWWRMLSVAIACQVVHDHPLARLDWPFLDCPGYQIPTDRPARADNDPCRDQRATED